MPELSDIERLLAVDEIKRLKARRDRAVDTKDWAALEAMHAPEHQSVHEGLEPWKSAAEMMRQTRVRMAKVRSIHQSHTPDIVIESRDRATGVWAMEDRVYWMQGDEEHWFHGWGFYHESYERRNGAWVFTWRRLERLRLELSPGGVMPPGP